MPPFFLIFSSSAVEIHSKLLQCLLLPLQGYSKESVHTAAHWDLHATPLHSLLPQLTPLQNHLFLPQAH